MSIGTTSTRGLLGRAQRSRRWDLRIIAALAFAALTGTACGHDEKCCYPADAAAPNDAAPGGSQPDPPAPPTPYSGSTFTCDVIHQPVVRDIVLYDGRMFAEKITASGAFEGNVAHEEGDGELSIEGQRNAYWVVAAGVLSSSDDKPMLLDKGLKALEWGFAQQGADGSFPEERGGAETKNHSLHPKSEFLELAARSLLLLRQCSDVDAAVRARAAMLEPKLAFSATWLAQSQDLVDFTARAKNTNQLFFVATGLQEAGVLADDAALIAAARSLMANILARQVDGVFPENEGFDTSYQMVSIDELTHYTSTIIDSTHRAELLQAGQRGIDRFLLQVRPDGTIDTTSNTRTRACSPPIPGPGPKGKDIDIIPLRLYQFGYLAGSLATLAPIADRIMAVGQGFEHQETCADCGACP